LATAPEQALDEVQAHVDARGDTRGRDHRALVHPAHVASHRGGGVLLGKAVEGGPVGRRRVSVEQT
jgi:hypothetical protein